MRRQVIVLTAVLAMAPLGAKAADLVVWWDEGYYAEESAAVREIVEVFEQDSGKQVELVLYPQDKLPYKIIAALKVGQPPDFAFGFDLNEHDARWAFEDRLVDISDVIGHFSDLFDPDALASVTWRNAKTGQKALYGLPMGRTTNHLHVWKSLLETAGYKLADIPREWDAFWAFWCDEVQPAVRRAAGRDDIWGIGLLCQARHSTPGSSSISSSAPTRRIMFLPMAISSSRIPRLGDGWLRPSTATQPCTVTDAPRPAH